MDHAELVGVGYRYGKWQPMATWSMYRGTVVTDGVLTTVIPASSFPNLQQTISLTIKYDLTTQSDLKIQYDNLTDHSDPSYTPNYGNADLLTFSYDSLF
jgi:predicted porin